VLSDCSPELRETCYKLFELHGAAATLTGHPVQSWYERLKTQIVQFDKINKVLGDRFLAYSVILGIQVRALTLDTVSPLNTAVHFTLDDEQIRTLALGEFRKCVVQALLFDNASPRVPRKPFGPEQAIELLGPKNLLLAPLFDLSIDRVLLASIGPDSPRCLVAYRTKEGAHLAELGDFLDRIRTGIKQDISATTDMSFTIDLSAVEQARKAAETGEFEHVIALLSSWPGLLSMLQGTPVAKQLNQEQLALLGEGVCLLGEALERLETGPWSEELYKLGLMIVREGPSAGRLCANLGRANNLKGEFGNAIGLLNRALMLGYPEEQLLPELGRALLKQGKVIAAAALLEVASSERWKAPISMRISKKPANILKMQGSSGTFPLSVRKTKEND